MRMRVFAFRARQPPLWMCLALTGTARFCSPCSCCIDVKVFRVIHIGCALNTIRNFTPPDVRTIPCCCLFACLCLISAGG